MRKLKSHSLTSELIQRYAVHLQEQERVGATVVKYTHAPTTVNSTLAAVNGFLSFMGWW